MFSCQSEAKFINRSKSSSKWYSKVLKYHVEKWWLEWGLLANTVPHVLAEIGIGERRPRLRRWQRLREKEQDWENSSSNNNNNDDDDDDHNIHISSEIYVFASRFLYNECNPHLPHPPPVIKKQLHSLLLGGNFCTPLFSLGKIRTSISNKLSMKSSLPVVLKTWFNLNQRRIGGSANPKEGRFFAGWTFAQAGWCFFVSFNQFAWKWWLQRKKHEKKWEARATLRPSRFSNICGYILRCRPSYCGRNPALVWDGEKPEK